MRLVGEFAFQAKFERREDIHKKTKEMVEQFFITLQQDVQDWIALGTTKTAVSIHGRTHPRIQRREQPPKRLLPPRLALRMTRVRRDYAGASRSNRRPVPPRLPNRLRLRRSCPRPRRRPPPISRLAGWICRRWLCL